MKASFALLGHPRCDARASNFFGPWTELATTVDAARNTATATVASFSFFALSDEAGLPVEVDSYGVE